MTGVSVIVWNFFFSQKIEVEHTSEVKYDSACWLNFLPPIVAYGDLLSFHNPSMNIPSYLQLGWLDILIKSTQYQSLDFRNFPTLKE